jgi:hypothetical protein
MEHFVPMKKCGSVVSFGPQCTKTPRIFSEGAQYVSSMVTSLQEMPCPSPPTFKLKSSMSGDRLHGTFSDFREL